MIQSHYNPEKSLRTHIREVKEAAFAILNNHSALVAKAIGETIDPAVQFHDLGKAIPEFQKYIANPGRYRGDPLKKAHTPVSLLLWLLYARKHNLPKDLTVIVATCVWQHHGDFPLFEEIVDSTCCYDYENDHQINAYPLNQVKTELNLELALDPDADAFDAGDIIDYAYPRKHTFKKAGIFKLKALLLYSLLIEADRTHLALSTPYRQGQLCLKPPIDIAPDIVTDFIERKIKRTHRNTELNHFRTLLRKQVIANANPNPGIESVTLPTGLGKTLIAAQWVLTQRRRNTSYKKIIVVLPFLSIIDQTVREYKQLLAPHAPSSLILESHAIAERKYTEDAAEEQADKYNDAIDFFAETWAYDIVITTFDQFLYTLLSSKKHHLMRFHSLADALIVIDEIQALPPILWQPLSTGLELITENLNTKALIMSATQPEFLNTKELVPNPRLIFSKQNRYRLVLNHTHPVGLNDFIDTCKRRIKEEKWHEKRVLLVFNTRKSARIVLDALEKHMGCRVIFLSADVTPKERLQNIDAIKKNTPCLVIATQCIEAGVDIDMDFAIRDFAPLDAIIQCAGRCNRNGLKSIASIEIVKLIDPQGAQYARQIYDTTLLEKTEAALDIQANSISEKDIFPLIGSYFSQLKSVKDTGLDVAEKWTYWEQHIDVKKLLRDNQRKYTFIVAAQDSPKPNEKPIKAALKEALDIPDRWKRKRKIRTLAKRLAELTISVWETARIDPDRISERIGCFNFLKDDYYLPGKGFTVGSGKEYPSNTDIWF